MHQARDGLPSSCQSLSVDKKMRVFTTCACHLRLNACKHLTSNQYAHIAADGGVCAPTTRPQTMMDLRGHGNTRTCVNHNPETKSARAWYLARANCMNCFRNWVTSASINCMRFARDGKVIAFEQQSRRNYAFSVFEPHKIYADIHICIHEPVGVIFQYICMCVYATFQVSWPQSRLLAYSLTNHRCPVSQHGQWYITSLGRLSCYWGLLQKTSGFVSASLPERPSSTSKCASRAKTLNSQDLPCPSPLVG